MVPDAISHQSEVLRQITADLRADVPGGLPAMALGLVIGGTVHFVDHEPPLEVWPTIAEAARTLDVTIGGGTAVVPLLVDGDVAGLLVATGQDGLIPLALLRLLGRHLAAELDNARLHSRLETLLRDYTSAGIAETLLAGDDAGAPADQQRDITVLFADLRGFTTFTEKTAWEVVVSHLNQIFAPAIRVVEDHGGTVANLMGDAIMATFGAVRTQPDHPYLGATAGLALTRAFAGDNPGMPRFGVGVNSGSAVVGDIGGLHRRVFTAIGDTVNLASRLESRAAPGEVIIGDGTYRAIRLIADAEPLPPLRLKGKEAPVQAYVLRGLDDAGLRPETMEIRPSKPRSGAD